MGLIFLRDLPIFSIRFRTQKTRKPIKKKQKTENESNVNIAETDRKYSEISQNISVFEEFPIILEKKGNGPKVIFGSVSVLMRFHSTRTIDKWINIDSFCSQIHPELYSPWIHTFRGQSVLQWQARSFGVLMDFMIIIY